MKRYNFKKQNIINKKGFTLVELLAVIVILAIIMIIAIPAVLNTMDSARKKSFVEYANKVILKAQEKYTLRSFEGLPISGVIVYDIENDLELSNTGDFKGYVIIDATESDNQGFYVYLYDKTYLLDLKSSNDINTDSLVSANQIEEIPSVQDIVEKAGYEYYYTGNSSTINEASNSKYEFLDSLVLDGDKYINTNVIPNDNTKLEMEFVTTSFYGIIGSRTAMSANDSYVIFGHFKNNEISYYVYWANVGEQSSRSITNASGHLKITYSNKTLRANDTVITTLNPTTNINARYPMYLFTVSNASTPDGRLFKGTFYSCKIYEGDRLIRNFVPAKNKTTGEILIYDKAERKEYPFIKH